MIGRYVLATAAVVLLVVGLLLGTVVYLGLHYGAATDSRVRIGTLAEAAGLRLGDGAGRRRQCDLAA